MRRSISIRTRIPKKHFRKKQMRTDSQGKPAQRSASILIIHCKIFKKNKMKKYFFPLTLNASSIALFSIGCRKIEMDGEKEVIIINGGGNTGQTITLQGRNKADTVLHKQKTYILKGLVYMIGNHTITI